MKRFNVSAWALEHQQIIVFLLLLLTVAGLCAYLRLARRKTRSSPSRR